MSTNIQDFSGDVQIRGTTFIKANSNTNNIAIGTNAGETIQGVNTVAVGVGAGRTTQGASAVAVGDNAGETSQGTQSVAVGIQAGQTSQGASAVAVGREAGETSQGNEAVAMGYGAGQTSQGSHATAVGNAAGSTGQGTSATAVGHVAGLTSQGAYATAVGRLAGESSQGAAAVAMGNIAGRTSQGADAVAVGNIAGTTSQGSHAVAVGYAAGSTGQGAQAVAVGYQAGQTSQNAYATAVGRQAGQTSQGNNATAMGNQAGQYNQRFFCTAIGHAAGTYNQSLTDDDSRSVAIGADSGLTSQGIHSIAIGHFAGHNSQPNQSTVLNASGIVVNGVANGFSVRPVNTGTGSAVYYTGYEFVYSASDDRLKIHETLIKDATTTLMKLSPQNYLKQTNLADPVLSHYESGLMAQDIWYDVPELRHIVSLGVYADPTPEKPLAPSDSIEDDPDYSAWGSEPAQVKYDQLIPYTIKSIQEIVTELPRTKTTVSNTWAQDITGLVVSADTNTHKTNTIPIVTLSNVHMDKKWYGVVSDKKTDTNDYDTLVDTKGDTCIWVTDVNGPLESGDLVTSSNVSPGYAQKQGDDSVRNYTIAKVTQDCDFTESMQRAIRVPKKEFSNVNYYILKTDDECGLYDYEQQLSEKSKKIVTETVYAKRDDVFGDKFYYYDSGGTIISKTKHDKSDDPGRSIRRYIELSLEDYNKLTPKEQVEYTETQKNTYFTVIITESTRELDQYDELEVRVELVDVLDENGQIVWEDTTNTVPAYTLVDHGTYKAALVSCKLI